MCSSDNSFNDITFQKIQQFASGDAGKQLIDILKKSDSHDLQQAVSLVSSGNLNEASRLISSLSENHEIQTILKQWRDHNGGNGR